jgi:hypothetical protein
MSLGITPPSGELYGSTRAFCEERLAPTSMYRLLAEQGGRLFADETFADLFEEVGRRSVPPRIVATVMVLQRLEGASDREAVDRFAFDLRWKYAAGELAADHPGFVHTVLVDMRERLRRSDKPTRIFDAVLEMAKGAGLVGRKRVPDRVISTVDPEARHGHKTAARGFDGYKGHVAIDPDSEIITATEVTAGNAGDASAAEALLRDVLPPAALQAEPAQPAAATSEPPSESPPSERVEVYGDASYGTADLVEKVEATGVEANMKVQPPSPPGAGMFSQDDFAIDTQAGTVRCPGGALVVLRTSSDGSRVANFGEHCDGCPMRAQCTRSKKGRGVWLHPKHELLDRTRKRQRDPGWRARYRATRPKVERKIAHLMRRKHGGRRARMRGRLRVAHDFALLAAAINLARLATRGVRPTATRA